MKETSFLHKFSLGLLHVSLCLNMCINTSVIFIKKLPILAHHLLLATLLFLSFWQQFLCFSIDLRELSNQLPERGQWEQLLHSRLPSSGLWSPRLPPWCRQQHNDKSNRRFQENNNLYLYSKCQGCNLPRQRDDQGKNSNRNEPERN